MKKKLSKSTTYHNSFCHKPQMERIKEVEQSRKVQKRVNKIHLNFMKFHGIHLTPKIKGSIKWKEL